MSAPGIAPVSLRLRSFGGLRSSVEKRRLLQTRRLPLTMMVMVVRVLRNRRALGR